jgi:hypothetical protein
MWCVGMYGSIAFFILLLDGSQLHALAAFYKCLYFLARRVQYMRRVNVYSHVARIAQSV